MRISAKARPAVASAAAVLAVGALLTASYELGPHAQHMGLHIVAMNVVAPLLAVLTIGRVQTSRASWLWMSALGQIVLLWASHLPALQDAALQSHVLRAAIHAVLLLVALSFWITLLSLSDARRWHAIPALLLTGKLVCLLAALLVFAPRALYGAGHHGNALDDQQLAGLLMIAACPLSYLVAAVILAVQFINRAANAPLPARQAG